MSGDNFYTFNNYMNENKMTATEEDYLEMICRLSLLNEGFTRVNDIAYALNVKPPSVTKMVKKLKEDGLITYKRYGRIRLTPEGLKLGKYLLYRHDTVSKFLELILGREGILEETEKIEHTISDKTLEGLRKLTEFFEAHEDIRQKFINFK